MTSPKEESDQLPEEQPAGAGADEDAPGSTRKDAQENAGGANGGDDDDAGEASGNPKNAG